MTGKDTMRRSIAAGVVTLSLLAGMAVAYGINAVQSRSEIGAARDGGTAPASPTPSPTSTPEPVLAGPLRPGAVDPVRAGMTIREAIATGYIEPDKERGEACEDDFYRWRDPNKDGLDLLTTGEVIVAIGIRSSRYRTEDGIGVGSRLSEVKEAYPTGRTEIESDYGQAGVLVRVDDAWLGLLFGEVTPDQLDDSSMVTFAEVSVGDRPGMIRDGC